MILRCILITATCLTLTACNDSYYPDKPMADRTDTLDYQAKPYDAFLADMPCESTVQYRERIIPTDDGCRLYIREIGKGEPLLILHGGWGHEMEPLYAAFRHLKENYRLIFYDQRGSLRSPCVDNEVISVKNHVRDVQTVLDTLSLENATLIGHSMGGYLAVRFADAKGTSALNGMILMATMPPKHNFSKWMETQQEGRDRMERPEVKKVLTENNLDSNVIDRIREYSPRQRGKANMIIQSAINLYDVSRWKHFRGSFGFQPGAGQQAAITMERTFECRLLSDLCFYIDMRFFAGWDYREAIAEADFPVYYIHGTDDFLPLSNLQESLKEAPNTQLRVIPRAGHVLWIDQPEVINDLLPALLE